MYLAFKYLSLPSPVAVQQWHNSRRKGEAFQLEEALNTPPHFAPQREGFKVFLPFNLTGRLIALIRLNGRKPFRPTFHSLPLLQSGGVKGSIEMAASDLNRTADRSRHLSAVRFKWLAAWLWHCYPEPS